MTGSFITPYQIFLCSCGPLAVYYLLGRYVVEQTPIRHLGNTWLTGTSYKPYPDVLKGKSKG